jgi:hypothetical protein
VVTSLAGFAGSEPLKVVHVRRSIWRGQEQEPKTPNTVRVVDIAEVLAKAGKYIIFAAADTLLWLRKRYPLMLEI